MSAPNKPPSLAISAIDLVKLRELAEQDVYEAVDTMPTQPVTMVINTELLDSLRVVLVRGMEPLLERGLDSRVQVLDGPPVVTENESVLFVVRPTVRDAVHVCRVVKALQKESGDLGRCYRVCCAPHWTHPFRRVLDEEDVLGLVEPADIALDMVALDHDVVTMNMGECARDLWLHRDRSVLDEVVHALGTLQDLFGPFRELRAKGDTALSALRGFVRAREKEAEEEAAEAEAARTAAGASGGGVDDRPRVLPPSFTGKDPLADPEESGGGGGGASGSATEGGRGGSEVTAPQAVNAGEIDGLLVLDRSIDPVSPLITPLTLEGLIDELMGIRMGRVMVDESVAKPAGEGGTEGPTGVQVPLWLNSEDRLFSEVRDANVSEVMRKLHIKGRDLSELESQRHAFRQDADVSAMRNFVKQIPGLQVDKMCLSRVLGLAEVIQTVTHEVEFSRHWTEERMALDNEDMSKVLSGIEADLARGPKFGSIEGPLRRLCVLAIAQGGLQQTALDRIRKVVLHVWGPEHLVTLINLERMGLLPRAKGIVGHLSSLTSATRTVTGPPPPPAWSSAKTSLRLVVPDVDPADPDDMAYTTSGYAPALARVVECALVGPAGTRAWIGAAKDEKSASSKDETSSKDQTLPPLGGWNKLGPALKSLPGSQWEGLQLQGPGRLALGFRAYSDARNAARLPVDIALPPTKRRTRRTLLVFVIGGLSFVEIAAMRFLSEKLPVDIIMATTHLTNGKNIIRSAMPAYMRAAFGGPAVVKRAPIETTDADDHDDDQDSDDDTGRATGGGSKK